MQCGHSSGKSKDRTRCLNGKAAYLWQTDDRCNLGRASAIRIGLRIAAGVSLSPCVSGPNRLWRAFGSGALRGHAEEVRKKEDQKAKSTRKRGEKFMQQRYQKANAENTTPVKKGTQNDPNYAPHQRENKRSETTETIGKQRKKN